MRLFRYELLKIATKKLCWGFLAAALAVNVLALWWLNRPGGLPHADTKAVYDTIRNREPENKLEYVQEQIDLMDAYSAKESYALALESNMECQEEYLAALREEYEAASARFGNKLDRDITGAQAAAQKEIYAELLENLSEDKYAAYLQYVENQAAISLGSSIFGSSLDDFSRRNTEKTRDDFSVMKDIKTTYDVNTGLSLLFNSPSTDILLLILIVAVCLALITEEKDKRLFLLIKATPGGKGRTIAAKLGAMAVCVVATNLLIFACNIFYASSVYGLGDLSRSIQSVPDMMGSTMRLSVSQFIVLFFTVKTAGLFAVGMTVMLFAIHARHSILMLLLTALASIGSTLLTMIHPESRGNWFRYLNLTSYMRPYEILRGYKNLNWMERPVNLIPIFCLFAAALFIALLTAVYLSFVLRRGLDNNLTLFKLKKLRLPLLFVRGGYRWYEFRKLAFSNKALLILFLFALIQGYTVRESQPPYLGYDHYYFKYTMNNLQGPLTDEKETFILKEKARFDAAQAALDELEAKVASGELGFEQMELQGRQYQNILAEQAAFNRVYVRYEYIKNTPGAQFLYDTGYAKLFGMDDADEGLASGMKLAAVLALCLCGVFAMEYKTGMYKVLNATKRGHGDTIQIKWILSGLLALTVFVCAYLPDILYIQKNFGLHGLDLPLVSILPTELGRFPTVIGGLPVWGYIVILFLMRLVVCMGVALLILALSLAIRHNVYTVLCALGLLLVPLFLHQFGVGIFDLVSLLALLTTNRLFLSLPLWQSFTQCGLYIAIAAGCVWFIIRRFGRANPV